MESYRYHILESDSNKQPEIIKRLLEKRQKRNTEQKSHSDSKSALIVAEGGKLAAYSAGAMDVLTGLGLLDVFDDIYANSAGACIAAYAKAGQMDLLPDFLNLIAHPQFINPFRPGKIMDLSYLDWILQKRLPLNQEAIYASGNLHIGVTNRYGKGEYITPSIKNPVDVRELIKASCAVPVVVPEGVVIDGEEYWDGGTGNPIPVEDAIERGASDIFVIANRSPQAKQPLSLTIELYSRIILRNFPPKFQAATIERYRRLRRFGDKKFDGKCDNKDINVGILCPPDTSASFLLSDYQTMVKMMEQGGKHMRELFNSE